MYNNNYLQITQNTMKKLNLKFDYENAEFTGIIF